MRPRDRSAQYDRRRLIERIADKRRPTLLSGASSIAGTAGLTGVNGISVAALDAAGWYDWRWGYRVPILVDRSLVAGSCANYPLYLSEANMPAGLFAAAQASGDDLLVTAADGTTKLAHDLVHFAAGTPAMELHALLPTLDPEPIDDYGRLLTDAYGGDPGYLATSGFGDLGDSALDVVAWLYAGNPYAADQRNAAGVWGDDYLQVMHLGEAAGNYADSSGNGQTGVDNATTHAQAGPLFGTGAMTLNGTSAYLLLTGLADTSQVYTLSWWINSTQAAHATINRALFDSQTGRINAGWLRAGTGIQYLYDGAYRNFAAPPNDGAWHLQHLVLNGPGSAATLYTDGGSPQVVAYTARSIGGAVTLGCGYTAGANSFIAASMDEFRIRLGTVTAEWAATERANQYAPATFYSAGTPQIARL